MALIVSAFTTATVGAQTPRGGDPCVGPYHVTSAEELIAAINCANAAPDPDTIYLNADITLTSIDNVTTGNNGLPVVNSPIIIEGQGHVLERDVNSADMFRFVLLVGGGDLTMNSVTVRNGVQTLAGGAVFLAGGGALRVVDCTFTVNEGKSGGGAIGLIGLNSSVVIERSIFTLNKALNGSEGGALLIVNGARATIHDSAFVGNHALLAGGAIGNVSDDDQLTIVNCLIAGNRTDGPGNGDGGGGGVYNAGALHMVNCTIAGNYSRYAGGLRNYTNGVANVTNCLIGGNFGRQNGPQITNNGVLNLRYSGLQDGIPAISGAGVVNDLGGLITFAGADELFVDPIDPNLSPTTAGDYRLVSGAPGVDAADYDGFVAAGGGMADLDGAPRTVDSCVDDNGIFGSVGYLDMGPYESQDDGPDNDGNGVPDICDGPCGGLPLGDVNESGAIDLADVSSLAAIVLDDAGATSGQRCAADVNEDGAVDGLDIQAFVNLLLTQ